MVNYHKLSLLFASLMVTATTYSSQEIMEINTVSAILPHIEQTTDLIIFDLDETILAVEHGDPWLLALYQEKQIPFPPIKEFYIDLVIQDEHRLLEDHTAVLIAELQEKGHTVIALTVRNTARFVHSTAEHLAKLGIDFSRSGISATDFVVDGFDGAAMYYQGIISVGPHSKGAVLMHLLEKLQINPTKIIFVDDKRHHIEAVQAHAQVKNIPFVGLRYNGRDNVTAKLSEADHKAYDAFMQQKRFIEKH